MNRKSIYFGFLPGESWEDKLKNAAGAGFAAVEVPGMTEEAERAKMKELFTKFGLICPSIMTSGSWQFPITSSDEEVRKKGVECIKTAIITAKSMGTDAILAVPGVVNDSICYEQAWECSIKALKTIIPYAEEQGVTIAIENVWNKFLLSPREFVDYVDGFGSSRVKAYFDVGNIVLYGFPQQWIKSLNKRIVRMHIKGFHTNGFRWTNLLEGSIDWKAVMAACREVGYEGYLTAEQSLRPGDNGLKELADDMDTILSL
jgi:hexulose-6-phosphate isomerase